MNGRSSDLLLVPRPSQQRQAVQWPTEFQDYNGGSQQRDCPGFAPDSLFIRTAGKPHRNQLAAKLQLFSEITLTDQEKKKRKANNTSHLIFHRILLITNIIQCEV